VLQTFRAREFKARARQRSGAALGARLPISYCLLQNSRTCRQGVLVHVRTRARVMHSSTCTCAHMHLRVFTCASVHCIWVYMRVHTHRCAGRQRGARAQSLISQRCRGIPRRLADSLNPISTGLCIQCFSASAAVGVGKPRACPGRERQALLESSPCVCALTCACACFCLSQVCHHRTARFAADRRPRASPSGNEQGRGRDGSRVARVRLRRRAIPRQPSQRAPRSRLPSTCLHPCVCVPVFVPMSARIIERLSDAGNRTLAPVQALPWSTGYRC